MWAPLVPAGTRLPVLIALSGTAASLDLEERRDGLLALAAQGQAIVVCPHDHQLSWDAGACCGGALAAGVDDLGYMAALLHTLAARPDAGPISLIGYSNGGRLVYDVACANPTLAVAYVVVAAARVVACRTTTRSTCWSRRAVLTPRFSTTPATLPAAAPASGRPLWWTRSPSGDAAMAARPPRPAGRPDP